MKVRNLPKLVFAILICQGAGFLGSIFTAPAISTWYVTLQKPELSPPNWVFAPVWTALFLMMGIALYLVLSAKVQSKKAVQLFGFQLGLNVAWSIIFFGLKNPGLALLEIVILWIAIFLTIKSFYQINKTAGYLLVPYLLWVSLALYLNYQIWILNEYTPRGIFS